MKIKMICLIFQYILVAAIGVLMAVGGITIVKTPGIFLVLLFAIICISVCSYVQGMFWKE